MDKTRDEYRAQTEKGRKAALLYYARRAAEDPARLAAATRTVGMALVLGLATVDELTAEAEDQAARMHAPCAHCGAAPS